MTKRLIVILLIASLSAVIFTACSRDNSNSETTVNEEEITTTKKDKDTMVEPTTKKHIEKETTTDVYVYDMVGDDKTIVLPTEDIIKICIQTPESKLEEYYTVSDSTKIKDLVNGIKKMTFIKGDTKNLATGSSMVVDLYYSEKNYMRISVLGKQAFIITGDKAGYFETNDYFMFEALVNAAI